MIRPLLASSVLGVLVLACFAPLNGQECQNGLYYQFTDHFYFTASSDQGAVGDVVGVDILLTVESPISGLNLFALTAAICYDQSRLDFFEEAYYTTEFDQIAGSSFLRHSEITPLSPPPAGGVLLNATVRRGAAEKFFASPQPVHLVTLFFRIKGDPKGTTLVRFCDDELRSLNSQSCLRSVVSYSGTDGPGGPLILLYAQSTRHVPATIRILEGEPTRTEPPQVPPNAKTYDEPPTAESAGIRFELSGGVAQPGGDQVPLELYATSNYEFSGFAVSLKFPADDLEIATVEEHTRPGVVRIDNEKGFLGMVLLNSRRRLGREGERVHLATLQVKAKEAAKDVNQVDLRFEDEAPFINWLAIYYQDRLHPDPLPLSAQVSPLFVVHGLVKPQVEPTALGDVNLDYQLDLADAVNVLAHLFQGIGSLLCPEAADFNQDGEVDISDPIGILSYLFLGAPAPPPREVYCGADG